MELLIVLLLLEGISVLTTNIIKKILELRTLKILLDSGRKYLDEEGLFSKIEIDFGTDLYIPLLNLFEISYLAINFDSKAQVYLESIEDELYDLLPLEKEIYEENPSYLTIMKFPKKIYKKLVGMPCSKMTNLVNGSITYFKRLKDGDVEVLYSMGRDSKMGAYTLRNRILGESEVINQAISEKYSNVDDFVKDAKEGIIDLDKKEDVDSVLEDNKDYLLALRDSLMKEKESLDGQQDGSVSPKEKVYKKGNNLRKM